MHHSKPNPLVSSTWRQKSPSMCAASYKWGCVLIWSSPVADSTISLSSSACSCASHKLFFPLWAKLRFLSTSITWPQTGWWIWNSLTWCIHLKHACPLLGLVKQLSSYIYKEKCCVCCLPCSYAKMLQTKQVWNNNCRCASTACCSTTHKEYFCSIDPLTSP